MNRPITITLDGVQYMVDIDIESHPADITYHVSTPQQFRNELPGTFDIVQPKNEDQPQYNVQAFTDKGRAIAEAIWQQVCILPPQFKGGKGAGRI